MKEAEARTLINEQTARRAQLVEVRALRKSLKAMLNKGSTRYPLVDSLAEAYLMGADNNLYLAEYTLQAMLEANE